LLRCLHTVCLVRAIVLQGLYLGRNWNSVQNERFDQPNRPEKNRERAGAFCGALALTNPVDQLAPKTTKWPVQSLSTSHYPTTHHVYQG
jgi:hypothetical protein